MTQKEIEFIFEALREIREDLKDLKKFKNYCQGGFWVLTFIAGVAGFIYTIKCILA